MYTPALLVVLAAASALAQTVCPEAADAVKDATRCTFKAASGVEHHAQGSQVCKEDGSVSTCTDGVWVDGAPGYKLNKCEADKKVGTGASADCPLVQTVKATRIGLPKSFIMMIPDGASPDAFTLARFYKNITGSEPTVLDTMLMGSVRNWAVGAKVTDSAAAATAYSTGHKTYNAGIAVLPAKDGVYETVGTNMEAAKDQKNMVTGVVVTSRVTHATPASFISHVYERDNETVIANQYVYQQKPDVVLGGGKKFFNDTLIADLKKNNYTVAFNKTEFNDYCAQAKASGSLRLYGLFAKSHVPYELDRAAYYNETNPSLAEMVKCTLELLENNPTAKENGFFIMIEGSRIDHAEHANDGATTMVEAHHYAEEVMAIVKEFMDRNPSVALMSAADHATGGLSLGRDGIYDFFPEKLQGQKASNEYFDNVLVPKMLKNAKCGINMTNDAKESCANEVQNKALAVIKEYFPNYNISDAHKAVCLNETKFAVDAFNNNKSLPISQKTFIGALTSHCLMGAFNEASLIGWTTGGHDGKDIGLYCYGNPELLRKCNGPHDNTNVGKMIFEFLGLDAEKANEAIRSRMPNAPDVPAGAKDAKKARRDTDHHHH